MKVDIAIMTIREDEFTAVRRCFKTERQRIPDGRTYLIGQLKTEKQTYTIAIARCSEQGTDASQRLAHYIIHNLDPRLILVVGIAGGVPRDEFTLGDVVVSTRIVNPNVDVWHPDGTTDYTTRGGPPHPLVENIVSLLPGEPQLASWTDTIQLERPTLNPEQTNITGDDEWREKVRQSLNWHFGEEQNRGRPPTFTIGHILSSNHLMKDPTKFREIFKTHRSILAVEMEVAGVYEAAQGVDHLYPVMAIRGISDIIGLQRNSRWTAYACQTAAAFTHAFIMTDPLDPPLNSANFQTPAASSEIFFAQLRDIEEPSIISATPPNQTSKPTSEASITTVPLLSSVRERQYRAYLLKLVEDIWITGVLKHSLYQDVLLQLGLREEPGEVANPFRLSVQETDLPARRLIADTSIAITYTRANGRLLILGEPGAGKTTSLLELTRKLLLQANQHNTHPLPVIFPLSSWAEQRQQLDRWLIEELHTKYSVPRRLAEQWMNTEQVIPLLDGLDEVAESTRAICVTAINNYCRDHPLQPLVVCCRRVEYEALSTHVALRKAVLILPLRREQIDKYFTYLGTPVAAQQQLFMADSELQDLITTPLLLNIFTLAYQGVTTQEFSENRSEGSLRQRLFAQYIQRMFTRRSVSVLYTQEQTIHWLTWLAYHLKSDNLTVFYLEHVQPHWLPLSWERIYRIINGLVIGLLAGLGIGLLAWLVLGPILGLVLGLVFVPMLAGGYIRGLEAFSWSWQLVWRRRYQLLIVLPAGPLLGLLAWRLDGAFIGLFVGLLMVMFVGLGYGLSLDKPDLHFRPKPDSGVLRSTRNGLVAGLSFGLGFGLVGGLLSDLIGGLGFGLVAGLGFGLIGGTSVTGIIGGFAYFQQRLLLTLLWHLGKIPRNYRHFLDYATERVLVRQVGAGYMFVHGLLMDYFATLDPSLDTSSKTVPPTNAEL